ncbi:MAG: sigma-54-dependent Fis family transcriptional regulator [Bacteroidetes bacterium]|nr:sigma-54-dependent Fis family transcriptional regulator [Bacteroidota bacterium]
MNEADIQSIKQRFGIIGNSPKLNHAIEVAAQVAPTDMTVLITGDSGVGKESFSKIIHQLSRRKHGQFIAINCGAIPEGTIDSELFGHEKGSFTGAYEARKGYFEVTDKGSIFLDEIGEMPPGTQARLLRVLEYGEYIRVGSSKVQKCDVRVIVATNKDLLEAVQRGKFREDLFYRLNTVPIFVPPLRDRENDIILLFRKFSSDFSEKYRTKPLSLTTEAQELLIRYPFPGNIRQLKNITEQISVLEMNRQLTAETLSRYLPRISTVPAVIDKYDDLNAAPSERDILYKVLFDLKKDVNDMKIFITDMQKNRNYDKEVDDKYPGLFETAAEPATASNTEQDQPVLIDIPVKDGSTFEINSVNDKNIDVQDITHIAEDDDSLSLEKKEKELIIKALHKNNNKRKYAAHDLGISERTLYRKIKQYEIDD